MKRILHTMLRVTDPQQSIEFYTQILGMRILRTLDQPEEKYSLTFLGFDEEPKTNALELTYNYGVSEYEIGTAYGHVAIGVEDINETYKAILEKGREFSLSPTRLKGSDETIAFLSDPDGYQIELIERPASWF